MGTLIVRALHTPGHRPEHTAFALIDTSRGQEPWAVLTGDSLFVGDVARPDLAIEPAEGARDIFRSLKTRLLTLPGRVEVWPAHLGGSMCGGPGMDMKIASTVGYERGHNPTLAIEDEDVFVEDALSQLGPQPPNFKAIVEINTGPLLTDGVDLPKLAPQQLERALAAGALIVDVRADEQFDETHIPGSVSIPITHAGFGSKLAWLATRDQDVIFVGEDEADERTARDLALAVGIRNLARISERRDRHLETRAARSSRASSGSRSRSLPGSPRRHPDPRRSRARASGTQGTLPGRSLRPGMISTTCPRRSIPAARSRSCAHRASAPAPPPACSSALVTTP